MLRTDNFAHIAAHLGNATSFIAVFGRLPPGSIEDQRRALRRQFGELAKLVHPDVVAAADKVEAGIAFRKLNELREAADEAIKTGTYDRPFTNGGPSNHGRGRTAGSTVLRSAADTYHLESAPHWRGDFSALYRARSIEANQAVIVKIAATPPDNVRLEFEADILSRCSSPTAWSGLSKLRPFMPRLVDSFLIGAAGGKRYRANVMVEYPGRLSLTAIRQFFPTGLDPRDAAWIFRRTLAQTVAARMVGVVHGAIVPDHVLVEPVKHEPLHIGWTTAVEPGQPITTIINRWREFYPPEVFRKESVDHRADLYMAGQTMVYLLGGDLKRHVVPTSLPGPVARIIKQCISEDPRCRPDDGRIVLDDFTQAIRNVWGRTYRPLILPVH